MAQMITLQNPFVLENFWPVLRVAIRTDRKCPDNPVLKFGSLLVDLANHTVRKNNELVKLTSTEYALLVLLAKNEGRVLTHQYILKEIWGMGYIEQTQYLRVFIAQLRKKIEDDPAKPRLLNTESGIGYRLSS